LPRGKWKIPGFAGDFVEMIASLYKLSQQNPTSSDIVLFKRSMAELRYAQRVFAPYRNIKKSASSAQRAPVLLRPVMNARSSLPVS